ncbi:SRPBCC domain-containing protein [Deinococcus saxicola]|uniref:SRPBCC domain-containing protein n=1 Tax=Deinococcus saxicola TaxID=249406 RepID=UPI003D0AFE03
MRHWWGPRGWEVTHCTVVLRPGDKWHYCMKCVDRNQGDFHGMESWGLAIYDEIVAPERLVYTDYFSDAEEAMNTDLPTSQTTLIFVDLGDSTQIISCSMYGTEDALKTVMDMGMLQGITQTWDRLAEHLAARREN